MLVVADDVVEAVRRVPVVEDRAAGPQRLGPVGLEDGEALIGVGWPGLAGLVAGVEAGAQAVGHAVGMAAELEPEIVLQIGHELGRHEAGLGEELGAALADIGELAGLGGVEEDHGLGAPAAVLGGAEGQDVDAALPGHLGRRHAGGGQTVGKARAVHVEGEIAVMGDLRDRLDLVAAVERAGLAGLADGHGHGLAGMDEVRLEAGNLALQIVRVDLAVGAVDRRHAGAMGEEFRRAALVLDDVGLAVAQDDAARPVDRGEGEGVGGGAGAHEEHRDLALEQFVEAALDALVEIARAIGGGHAGAVGGEGCIDRRMGAGPVIGSKDHGGQL